MTMTMGLRPSGGTVGQVARFVAVGAGGTLVNLAVFALLQPGLGAQLANVVGALVATAVGTAANQRFTFGVSGRPALGRTQLYGLVLTLLGTVSVAVALRAIGSASTESEAAVVAVVNVLFGALRFAMLRHSATTAAA